MTYLLDTNVISEGTKPRPNPNVIRWLEAVDEQDVFLSVATLAEIRYGVARMERGRRRDSIARWLEEELSARFEERILDIDRGVAAVWGRTMALARQSGSNIEAMDAVFAATAIVHGLTLVTRNTRHFERLDVRLFNPWI